MAATMDLLDTKILTEELPPYTKLDKSLPPYTLHDVACLYSQRFKPHTTAQIMPSPCRRLKVDCTINLHQRNGQGDVEIRQCKVSVPAHSTVRRQDMIDMLQRWASEAFQVQFTRGGEKHSVLLLHNTDVEASYMLDGSNWLTMRHLLGVPGWEIIYECEARSMTPGEDSSLRDRARRVKNKALVCWDVKIALQK